MPDVASNFMTSVHFPRGRHGAAALFRNPAMVNPPQESLPCIVSIVSALELLFFYTSPNFLDGTFHLSFCVCVTTNSILLHRDPKVF